MGPNAPEQSKEFCEHGNNPSSCTICKTEKLTSKFSALNTLGVSVDEKELESADIHVVFEQAMFAGLHGLPEELAERLGTVDIQTLKARAETLITEMANEENATEKSQKQIELIYQYIILISQVQGSASKGITPALAREVGEMECSLGSWSLKEKLHSAGINDYEFEFGYPSDHAVGIITVADGRKLYVDAQNGYIAEIELDETEHAEKGNTAYPIFEITDAKSLSHQLPDGSECVVARQNGRAQVPRYLGIRKDGTLHTVGNMHMMTNPESPIYSTQTAQSFRKKVPNAEKGPFSKFASGIEGGLVIQELEDIAENNRVLIDVHG
jgi:hypothetical protein